MNASADPGDEPVEWVDGDGAVIEVVTRRRMRAEGLRHRCTYVAVLVGPPDLVDRAGTDGDPGDGPGPDTEVVVHRRADWKDVYPGHWDLAFGGVCGVGEDWAPSARRELAEEAGIDLGPEDPLVDLGPVRLDLADTGIVGRVFVAAWPDPLEPRDGEVVALDRVPLGGLARWAESVPVCPDSATLVVPAVLAWAGLDPPP